MDGRLETGWVLTKREACEIGWDGVDRLIKNIPESEMRECRREGIQLLLRRRTLVLGGGEKVHLLVEVVVERGLH